MSLLIFCCPRALVTNITELTITSYAWMRTSEEQVIVTRPSKTRNKFPNITRLMRTEWEASNIKNSLFESRENGYCIICFDSFDQVKESKLIPCGHKSICPKCVIRLIAMRGKNTTCPQCRRLVRKYVVMEDAKAKLNKNTITLEDVEDNDKEVETGNVISYPTNNEMVTNHINIQREQERHCLVCFRLFLCKTDPSNSVSLSEGYRVQEAKLYPCGHTEVCPTCAALITLREVNRECPQCRRFVRRYVPIGQTEEDITL